MIVGRRSTQKRQRLVGNGDRGPFEASGRDPAFLVFHGFTGTPSELQPLLRHVAEAGYAVHAPLLPGHGTTSDALQPLAFDVMLAFARSEFERMRARHARIIVAGFSYGSLLAIDLAAANADRGSWVAGLILIGNALSLQRYATLPFGLFRRWNIPIPDAYLLKFRNADMRDRKAAANVVTYDRHPLRGAYQVYLAGALTRPKLAHVRCPTLVLHGGRDLVCPVANAAAAARALIASPEVTTRVYPESGHLVAADFDRDAVAADVLAFARRRESTPGPNV